jgi:hypothetical protein
LQAPATTEISTPSADFTVARPKDARVVGQEGDHAQSAANGTPPHILSSIESAMDQLTVDLTAFYIDQLEKRTHALPVSNKEPEVGCTDLNKDELHVRSKSQKTYEILILD